MFKLCLNAQRQPNIFKEEGRTNSIKEMSNGLLRLEIKAGLRRGKEFDDLPINLTNDFTFNNDRKDENAFKCSKRSVLSQVAGGIKWINGHSNEEPRDEWNL